MATRRPARRKVSVPKSIRDVPVSRAMLMGVRDELIERISAVESRFEARFSGLESRFSGLEAQFHDVRAEVSRMSVLIEEQNTRNAIVLEAIRAMIDRQDRTEKRLDDFGRTVASLASGHAGSGSASPTTSGAGG